MIGAWIMGLRRSLTDISSGSSVGLPLGHQLLIDLGHVTLGPLLAVYAAPEAAALWMLVAGVGKQLRDAWSASWKRRRDALWDALSICAPTALALSGEPPGHVGALMAAFMLAYAAERGRVA